MKYLAILFVICMWGCKENEENKPTFVKSDEAQRLFEFIDTIPFSVDTYTLEGKYEYPVGKIPHKVPIKFSGDKGGGEYLGKINKWAKVELVGGEGVKVTKHKDHYKISLDTIPKKDTSVTFIPDTVMHPQITLPYSMQEPPVRKTISELRKELDSLKIEIQKLKSKHE